MKGVMLNLSDDIEVVGHFSQKIIDLLGLSIPVGTEILLSNSTKEHTEFRHLEVASYLSDVPDILSEPDYISFRERDSSVEFVRLLADGKKICLVVPVRPSSDNKYFVRTLHPVDLKRFEKYVERGTFVRLTKD